ncbi:MAG: aminotransferase class III-fold pyridoxal phosphate-dependent enzyme, partial [Cyanobacteria bacterium J06649_11]
YIGSTPMSAGIPQAIQDLTVKFNFNDIESVKTVFANHPGNIACVILEPAKYEDPSDNFLHEVQKLCRENGAVFILDEMITGFRWLTGNAQNYYGVVPDLSTFGKGMGNGFAVSALVGKREIMELGGIYHDKERVFLLSSTHGGENHALAAAIATMNIFRQEDVIENLYQKGERLRQGINQAIAVNQLQDYFQVIGKPCNLVYATRDQNKQASQAFRTLFLQETIKRGLIIPSLVVSFSHSNQDVDSTIEAVDESLQIYRKALENGIENYLISRPVKPVFRTYC